MLDRWAVGHRLGQPGARASRPGRSRSRVASHCLVHRRTWRAAKPSGRPKSDSPDGVVVHGVQVGEHVDEALAHGAPLRGLVGVAGRELLHDVDAPSTRSIT